MAIPYEVRCNVKTGGTKYTNKRGWVEDKIVKIFHVWARTPEQACQRAKKYGRPLSARKMQIDELYAKIELLPLKNEPSVYENYINPLGLDEMLWLNRGRKKHPD